VGFFQEQLGDLVRHEEVYTRQAQM
jgi:hypothetical protein